MSLTLTFITILFKVLLTTQNKQKLRFLEDRTKWQVDFESEGKQNEITIQAGRFFPLNANIKNNDAKNLAPSSTDLSLTDDKVKTLQPSYTLSTFAALSTKIHVGVPCATADATFTVTLVTVDKDNWLVSPLKVIVATKETSKIQFQAIPSPIPAGGYGWMIYKLIEPPVDALQIKWTAATDAKNDPTAVIAQSDIASGAQVVSYSKFSVDATTVTTEQKFQAAKPNNCYELATPTFSFTPSGTIPPVTADTVKAILSNYKLTNNPDTPLPVNSVSLEITPPSSPHVLSCALVCDNSDFPSDADIVKQASTTVKNAKFYKTYVSEKVVQYVRYDDLSRGKVYKIRCMIESINSKQTDVTQLPIDFGTFRITVPDPEPTQCIQWKLNEAVDGLESKLVNYCQTKMSANLWKNNGCIRCDGNSVTPVGLKFPDPACAPAAKPQNATRLLQVAQNNRTIRVCAVASPYCATNYNNAGKKLTDDFNTLSTELATGDKIKKALGLADTVVINVNKTFMEIDEAVNVTNIKSTIISITNDTVKWSSTFNSEVECKAKVSTQKPENATFDDVFGWKDAVPVFISTDETNQFSYQSPTAFVNNTSYNILYACYKIARSPYHYKKSNVASVANFNYLTNNTEPAKNDTKPEKKDHKLPDIKTNPKKDNSAQVKDYQGLDDNGKKQKVDDIKKTLTNQTTRDALDTAAYLGDLVANTNCSAAANASECNNLRKDIQSTVVGKLQTVLDCSQLNNTINNTLNGTTTPDATLKLALINLFQISNFPDTLDKNSSKIVADLTKCLINKAPELLKLLDANNTDSKKDVARLMASVSSNMIDVTVQNQFDHNVDVTKINNQLITESEFLDIKSSIESSARISLQYGDGNFKSDNYEFYFNKVVKKTPARMLQTGNNTNITYDTFTVDRNGVKFNVLTPTDFLLTNISNKITNVGAIVYDKYPLLVYGNKNYSEKVISVKVYDADGLEIPLAGLTYPIKIEIPASDASFKYCVYYNEIKKNWDASGVKSENGTATGVTRCLVDHLTDFTIGNVDFGGDVISPIQPIVPEKKEDNTLLIVLLSIGGAILLGVIIFVVICCCRKRNATSDILINENTSNRDIQMKRI